jgi:hypothetical protein
VYFIATKGTIVPLNPWVYICIICIILSPHLNFAESVQSIETKITKENQKEHHHSYSMDLEDSLFVSTSKRVVYQYDYIFDHHSLDTWVQFYSEFLAFEDYDRLIQDQKISEKGVVLVPTLNVINTHYHKKDTVNLGEMMCFYRDVAKDRNITEQLKMATILTQEGRLVETERSSTLALTKQKINTLDLKSRHDDHLKKSLFNYMLTSLISYESSCTFPSEQTVPQFIGSLFLLPLLPVCNGIEHLSNTFSKNLNERWHPKSPEHYFSQFTDPKKYPEYVNYDHHIRYPDTLVFPRYYETGVSIYSSSDITHFNHDIRAHFLGKSNGKFSGYWIAGNQIQGFIDSNNTIYTVSPYGGIVRRLYNLSMNLRLGISYYNGINLNATGLYLGAGFRYYIKKPLSLFVDFNDKGNDLGSSWNYLSFRYGVEYHHKNISYQLSYHKTVTSQDTLLSGIEGGISVLF